MPPNPLYAVCIKRAAQLLGGLDKLAAHIGADPRDLARWADGVGGPSDATFLKIVDIVLNQNDGTPHGVPLQIRNK
jgi:hypothetical protein